MQANQHFLLELTSREQDVAALIMQGKSNAAMAAELFISVSTLKTHISRILKKADCVNQKEFIAKSLKTHNLQFTTDN
ncbi:MAG: helix-turn-helix transcriptional regulator [Firmicutes bacterium]|nr:helix-turn-helix transcriptional regulator [Bacillota bacterium]